MCWLFLVDLFVCFSPRSRLALEMEQREWSIKLWTVKECYCKFRKAGVAINPNDSASVRERVYLFWGIFMRATVTSVKSMGIPVLAVVVHSSLCNWYRKLIPQLVFFITHYTFMTSSSF